VKRLDDPAPTCAYCGAPTKGERTCPAHRDLEQVDPHERPARKPSSERELGARNAPRLSKRAGREELY
jgi:hypothetical protein